MADVHRLLRLRRRRRRIRERTFNRIENPLNVMHADDIFNRFRFRPGTILYILNLISQHLYPMTHRNRPITPIMQLLVALRFYATGAFFILIGDSMGLSVATVSRCVHRVTQAICSLGRQFIQFPTGQSAARTKQAFYAIAGFPHVVGCIDGTFIRIQGPTENEQDYVNRKGFHSLNVQMTCDANFTITNCVAKWPGSVHDARMFRDSHLCTNFENGNYNGILLGDSAYPCRQFLMTPYVNADTQSKTRFNNALCRTRVLIEQTYGILKRRFACLHSGLRLNPQKSANVIVACVILHNLGIKRGDIINVETNNEHLDQEGDNLGICNVNDGVGMRELIRRTCFS